MSNQESNAAGASPSWFDRFPVGRLLLFVLLFLSFVPWISPPDIDLDPSWRMMMTYALDHHFQFGHDFVFTYGPLGLLLANVNSGNHMALLLAWNFVTAAAFAFTILKIISRFSVTRQAMTCLFFFLIVRESIELLYLVFALIAGFELLRAERPSGRRMFFTTVFLALLSLIKFTYCLFAIAVVVTVVAESFLAKRRGAAFRYLAYYFGTLLLLWVSLRQNPLNLPAYFFNSLEISRGYGETMGLPTPPTGLLYGLIVLAGLILCALLIVSGVRDRLPASGRALILTALTYLEWKHGFLRSDGHMVIFFTYGLFVACFSPVLLERDSGSKMAGQAAIGLVAAASLLGIFVNFPLRITHVLETVNTDWRARLSELTDLKGYYSSFQTQWEEVAKKNPLKRTSETVGQQTVDVLSHFQGIALLNGLNLRPRPVPQGYSAYTPKLTALNAAYYESANAPAWVLQSTKTINHRFPTLDDADLLLALLRNYSFTLEDGSYLLWRRCSVDDRYSIFQPSAGSKQTGHIGNPISLADQTEQNIWAHLRIRPTLLGRLRSFFYKPAEVSLEVADNSGRIETFRLFPELASSGFLLNPLLRDRFDWIRFLNRLPCVRATSITVRVADDDRKYFQSKFEYEFDTLPEAPSRQNDKDAIVLAQVGRFRNMPVSLTAAAPLGPAQCGGETAVLLHAPSEMTYNIGPGATTLRAKYGLADNSYVGSAQTAGSKVVVEFVTPATGTRTLFERQLDPLHVPGDRGLQDLNVDLKGLGDGTLVIKNTVGQSNAWAWTVWRDLEILPVTSINGTGQPMQTGSNNVIMRYGHFASAPLSVRTGNPLLAVMVDGISMVQAHADSEIALLVPPGSKKAVGRFAFQEGAYTAGAATDGAEFTVVWKSGDDERTLLRRYLDPVKVRDDRGVQQFSVDLDKLPGGGTLLLRTNSGPAHSSSWDWTCWSDVTVGNPPPLEKIKAPEGSAALLPETAAPTTVPAAIFRDAGGFKVTPSEVTALIPPALGMIDRLSAVQVHPPSDLVIRLGDSPSHLHVQFGLQSGALDHTDGVDYEIEWQSPSGEKRSLYKKSLQPVTVPADRKVQTLDLPLEGISGGTLHLLIGCGPMNNSSFDWACWQGLEVQGAVTTDLPEQIPFTQSKAPIARPVRNSKLTPEDMSAVGFNVPPLDFETPAPAIVGTVFNEKALLVHAPGKMVISLPPGAKSLAGRFGFQDGAYSNDHPTDGAVFIIVWHGEDGTKRELFRQSLEPFKNIAERGLHPFNLSVESLGPGDLWFLTDPGPNNDRASDWTCWQGITIK